MIRGLRTIVYPVADLEAGKAWYGRVFAATPHHDSEFYVGYPVGGFELGLMPDGTPSDRGPTTYWGVDDIHAEMARLADLGAPVAEPVHDVGDGILVGAVRDPFGNRVGFIQNPHFRKDGVA